MQIQFPVCALINARLQRKHHKAASAFTDQTLWPVPIQNELMKLGILLRHLLILLGRRIGPQQGL
jgi:hypothetical protein